jgi:hypothetical protein
MLKTIRKFVRERRDVHQRRRQIVEEDDTREATGRFRSPTVTCRTATRPTTGTDSLGQSEMVQSQ